MPKNYARHGASGGRTHVRLFDYLCVALILSYVWRLQDLFPFLARARFPVLISLAALAVWVLGGHASAARSRFHHPIVLITTFILGWMILSIPGSVYPGLSFRFVFNDHLKTFLAMLVLLSSVRNFYDVERLALAELIGAVIYCMMILTKFHVGADGRLGELIFYDANDLAMFIVCTVPLVVYFVAREGKLRYRLLAALALPLLIMTLLKTGSRGGFLGLLAVVVALLVGLRAVAVKIRLGVVLAAATLMITLAGPRYWTMMETILHPEEGYNWNAQTGRIDIWKRGLGYIAARPLFGVGANAYRVAEGTLSPLASRQKMGIGVRWDVAHNSFIQIAAEIGLPGLLAFLALLWWIARTAWTISGDPKDRWMKRHTVLLGQSLAATVVGYSVSGFFLAQAYSAYLYSICAITVGLSATAGGRSVSRRLSRRQQQIGASPKRRWRSPGTLSRIQRNTQPSGRGRPRRPWVL